MIKNNFISLFVVFTLRDPQLLEGTKRTLRLTPLPHTSTIIEPPVHALNGL